MQIIRCADFFEEVWDYVPSEIVNDDFWEDNHKMIEQVTKEVYGIYKANLSRNNGTLQGLTIPECADFISVMFKYLTKAMDK